MMLQQMNLIWIIIFFHILLWLKSQCWVENNQDRIELMLSLLMTVYVGFLMC